MNLKVTPTLARYLSWRFIFNVLFLFGILLAIIYVFDTVELIRRAAKRPDVSLVLVLQMGLLKLPDVGQILLPFAVLFSALATFWQLTRRYELVVIRASGFSVWQFLAPVMLVAAGIGLAQMMVLNPLGAVLLSRFAHLEQEKLSSEKSAIALFREEGLWLRQTMKEQDQESYIIIHAEKITPEDWSLQKTTVLGFDKNDRFIRRIDSPRARLEPGQWVFEQAITHDLKPGLTPAMMAQAILTIPTTLTIEDVENSFASPQTIPFWYLPEHIKTLKETGFEASRLKVHFYHLMAQPLMMAAMVLLAAAVAMRPPRSQATLALVMMGVALGFMIFFLSSYLQALGAARELPAALAAWSPALICFLCGLSILMVLEDG